MPATRRSRASHGGGPAAKGAQQTLSFGNRVTKSNTASSKIHKPTAGATAAAAASIAIKEKEIGVEKDESAVTAITVPAQKEVVRQKTAEEELASQVTDVQIKRYWKAKQSERKAPRVHQGDLSTEEMILRLFDTSSQYGPCIGIARMKRWVRANKLGLQPPIEVLAVLLKEEEKGNTKIQRAYVDELMSSKFVVGDD